jgi:hypothetical protein
MLISRLYESCKNFLTLFAVLKLLFTCASTTFEYTWLVTSATSSQPVGVLYSFFLLSIIEVLGNALLESKINTLVVFFVCRPGM